MAKCVETIATRASDALYDRSLTTARYLEWNMIDDMGNVTTGQFLSKLEVW